MGSLEEQPKQSSAPQFPIIDFNPFTQNISFDSRLKAAKELVKACHETGFVYITNHGISPALLSETFSWSKKFFELDAEQRAQAAHPPGSTVFRGWSKVGKEIVLPLEGEKKEGVLDYNECYGIGSEANLDAPNVWIPDSTLPGFREFVTRFYAECWKLSELVLRALALGLGLQNEEFLLKFHDESRNELSLRHYPPVNESIIRSGEMDRLGAHTDFDSFSLLWQDGFGGLAVKLPGTGKWVDALPVDGTLIMNIGDVLARWSNDYLASTLHQVHLPPLEQSYVWIEGERMTKSRFSIPYFVSPKTDTVMVPFVEYCRDEKEKGEPLTYGELQEQRVVRIFQKD